MQAMLKLDRHTGQVYIEDDARHGQLLWDPMRYLREIGYQCKSKDPVLHVSDSRPYLQVKDGGSTLFTTHAEFKRFDLPAGQFVAVTATAQPPPVPLNSRPSNLSETFSDLHVVHSGPPALPPRPSPSKTAYLWLDPESSQLVLHTCRHPEHPERDEVVWISPNWKHCKSTPHEPSKATLQG